MSQENITSTMIYKMVWWLILSLLLIKALTYHMGTFMKDKTFWQQSLYYKYTTSVEDIMFCVFLAIDEGYDKFVFDLVTKGPGNCTLCSYCAEEGIPLNTEENHNYGWSQLTYFLIKINL